MVLLPPEPTFESIEGAGGRVAKRDDEHALCNGFFRASGAIARVTEYETGLVGHYTFRGATCEPDPPILDERFLAAKVRGRGVALLSGCSHAGVVNAALAAQQAFGGAPIDLLLGGYHLAGRNMEARIAYLQISMLEAAAGTGLQPETPGAGQRPRAQPHEPSTYVDPTTLGP